MALIITLNRDSEALSEPDEAAGTSHVTGQIILFPGVRYERWADARSGSEPHGVVHLPSQKTVARDWLEV